MRRVATPRRRLARRVGAQVSAAGGPVNAVKNAKNIGADCLQIFAGSPRSWARKLYSDKETTDFNKLSQSLDISPVFIHALYLVNLGSDNPELIQKSVNSLIYDLNNGRLLNSSGVIVHLGSHQGRGFASVVDQVSALINQILTQTETVPFVIENSAGQNGKIGSLLEIKALFDQVNNPRLKICLDSAHLFEAGYDLRQLSVVDDLIGQLEEINLLKEIICLHINDSKTELNSHHDQHANLGDGHIGLVGLAQFINHPGLAGLPLLLEVPGENGLPDARQISLARSFTEQT